MSKTLATTARKDPSTRDFYLTPIEFVIALYKTVELSAPTLDACCGTGNLVVGAFHGKPGHPAAGGIDIEASLVDVAKSRGIDAVVGDGLSISWEGEHIICNPPFSNMFEWLVKGVVEAESFVMLGSLSALASQKRKDFLKVHQPTAMIILSERPSFTPDGKTDAADYAWFVWKKGQWNGPTQFCWITSKDAK